MKLQRTRDMDMCSGPIFMKILRFSLPILAMNFLQLLFNAADMIVVGRFSGSEALAAVGATGALINLIINTFMGLSVGTSVVVAQDYGAQDWRGVSRSVHTSILLSVIGGVGVMIIGLLFSSPLLRIMGTPDDILDLANIYMIIIFIGVPASMIYNFGAAILRAIGDSRHPMYYLIITGAINVVLNMVFVIVFHWNVVGVALATIISQYISVVLIVTCLMRSDGAIKLSLRHLCIDKDKTLRIVKIGLPAGLQSALFSISNVLIQSAINSFGSTLIAANSASGNIEGLIGTTMNSFSNAAITFVGQNMGAKKYTRIDKVAKSCTVLVFATWIILGAVIVVFGEALLQIYTNDPAVVELGMIRMNVMMAVYFTCGIMNVFPGLTRGMGFSMLPMICTLIGCCVMRIVWLVTVFAWFPTVTVLFLCYPVTWSIGGIGQVISYFYARKKVFARGDMVPDVD